MIFNRLERHWSDDRLLNNKIDCNRYLTINQEKLSISEWSIKSGIPKNVIINRLFRGWNEADVLKPVKQMKKLTQKDANNIRIEYKKGNTTYAKLAKKYHVANSRISDIVNYKAFNKT